MRTAAELNRRTCGNNSYCIAVLLTEESHSAELASLFDRHLLHCNRNIAEDIAVYDILNPCYLLVGHSTEVVEVKTASLFVYKLTSLMNVVAENLSQSILEKMCCGMIAHDRHSSVLFYLCKDLVALGDTSLLNSSNVEEMSLGFDGIVDRSDISSVEKHTCIAYLSAALSVERCNIENDNNVIALNSSLYLIAVLVNSKNFCVLSLKC